MSQGYIDWKGMEKRETNSGGNGEDSIFLKFAPGKYRIRLVGKPYFYEQSFIPKAQTGAEADIPVISPGKDEDPLIPLGIIPTEKAICNLINRKEGGKLQVVRMGPSIFNNVVNYAHETGVDPASTKEGVDMLITVEDPKGNKRQRKYNVTFLQATPLTKEEVAKIKADGGLHDLEKLCKPNTVEEINELIKKYSLGKAGTKADFDDTNTDAEDVETSKEDDADDADVTPAKSGKGKQAAAADDDDLAF